MEAYAITLVDHPSFFEPIERFVGVLSTERRHFGPTAARNPKPSRSLIETIGRRGAFRMGASVDGQIVGMVRVDDAGVVSIVVRADWRGRGVGRSLGAAAIERASELGFRRLVIYTTRRSTAARRVGEALGCIVVEHGQGRTELIIDLPTDLAVS